MTVKYRCIDDGEVEIITASIPLDDRAEAIEYVTGLALAKGRKQIEILEVHSVMNVLRNAVKNF